MFSLFAELKRRSVVRVGLAYLAVGWAILQVVDTIADPLHLPEQFATIVVVLVGLGFPVALVLAWAFELTPEGVVRTDEVDPNAPTLPHKGRTSTLITATALVVALGYIGWDSLLGHDTHADPNAERSIAVLPFADMSPAGDQEWFGDGVADAILHDLAQSSQLKVISRSSSFTFRGDGVDIPTAAAALGARFILEGSVTRAEGRVRVIAQLIDAATDSHIWSQTFNRNIDDIFAVQTDIATAIGDALSITFGVAAAEASPPPSLETYELIARARAAQLDRSAEGLYRSVALLEEAVQSDPRSADALGELALANILIPYWDGALTAEARGSIMASADAAATAALALNPTDVEALVAGAVLRTETYAFDEAEALFQRALEVSPGSALVYNWYGDLLQIWDRGVDAVEMEGRAAELDPLQPANHYNLAQAYRIVGNNEAAAANFKRALEMAPDLFYARVELMVALYVLEDWAELENVAQAAPDPERRALHLRAAEAMRVNGTGDHAAATRLVMDWRPTTPDAREWGAKLLLIVGAFDEWASYQPDLGVLLPFGGNFISTHPDTLAAHPVYDAYMRTPPRDKLLQARWSHEDSSGN